MKRTLYSQPLSIQWAEYHKSSRRSRESVQQYFQRKNKALLTNPMLSPQKRQIESLILDLWASDASKSFLHLYFVDRALRSFLEGIALPDLDGIASFIKENGFASNEQVLLPNGKPLKISSEKVSAFPFGIHVPSEKKERGLAFNFIMNEDSELVLVWAIGTDQGWFPLNKFQEISKDTSGRLKGVKEIIQLAVNTIAYMYTFPSCIVNGVPKEIVMRDSDAGYSLTVGISEKIVESAKDSIGGPTSSPHFRRGHFRRLTADRYKKMKGKLIFVHQTMVKGSAKTVYTSDNIDEMVENQGT